MVKLTKTIILSIIMVLTGAFFVFELIVGHLTKSSSLQADAFHKFSDLIALIIGLVAVRLSKWKSSERNTYGWARAEILGSLINTVFLFTLCLTIYLEAIDQFMSPTPLQDVDLILYVGLGSLSLNFIVLALFLLQEKCSKVALKDTNEDESKHSRANMNMRGVFLNALGDSFGSVAIITSALLIKFAPSANDSQATWKQYIDPILGCCIATIIIATVIPLFKKSSAIILQTVPYDFNYLEAKEKIRGIDGVEILNDFHVWSLNPETMVASVHVTVSSDCDQFKDKSIVSSIQSILNCNKPCKTTIQLDKELKHRF